MTRVLQWFHLNFGAGNFRGRRPGTSALRMLLRLTAIKALSSQGKSPGNEVVLVYPGYSARSSQQYVIFEKLPLQFAALY